jgi:signal transduction histidine kinase
MKDEIKSLRNEELIRVGKIVSIFLVIPVVLQSILTDLNLYGFHRDWVLLRVAIVPVGVLAYLSYRLKLVKKFPGLPLIAIAYYIAGLHLYLVSQTGYELSLYFHSYIQLLIGLSILPLSLISFSTAVGGVVLSYLGLVLWHAGFDLSVLYTKNLVFLKTYVILTALTFLVLYNVRKSLFRKTVEQTNEIKERKRIIELQVKELADTQLALKSNELELLHNQALTDFAKQVSHDIRSPVTALNILTGRLGSLAPEQRRLIKSAADRINEIANGMLHLGKKNRFSETVAPPMHKPQVELITDLISSVIAEKRLEYSRRDLEIGICLNISGPLYVLCSSTQLKSAVSNLINNSVEAIRGSGRILVSISEDSANVQIAIQDNGQGIPEHLLPRIGERGQTFGKEQSNSGSGLGVFQAKAAVLKSGGTIRFASRFGAGTTVFVTLPKALPPVGMPDDDLEMSSKEMLKVD